MTSTKLIKIAAQAVSLAALSLTAVGLTVSGTGCGSTSPGNGNPGSGGNLGSGGSASGGAPGSGGTTAAGGSSTGGTTGAGGVTASGGAPASGGSTGAGGIGGGGGGTSGGAGNGASGRAGGGANGSGGAGGRTTGSAGSSGGMTLTSPDQPDGAKFGTMFTCAAMNGTFGAGVNPELDWTGVPAGTISFAMTFIDTKIGANMAMGQHWAIWNIPADVRQFPKGSTTLTGSLAAAMQTNKYLAPCPSGNDTYEFTLYALSQATLNVSGASGSGTSNSAGVAKVLTALQAVTPLATATLHGTSGPMGK
jgi:phosphatidylethanolamine-binding protein (PEBP) family uncharacterized protein